MENLGKNQPRKSSLVTESMIYAVVFAVALLAAAAFHLAAAAFCKYYIKDLPSFTEWGAGLWAGSAVELSMKIAGLALGSFVIFLIIGTIFRHIRRE
jgi:hypothetical protein